MICPHCSLLCDEVELDTIACGLREKALVQLTRFRSNRQANQATLEADVPNPNRVELINALELLRNAKRVLITGRIATVQSARAAIRLAAKTNATIDCAEAGHAFRNIQAIQRVGGFTTSIAEARDHADLLIVVGDDSMLNVCPRMPTALCRPGNANQTALLLGQFSPIAVEAWKEAGFDAWSVACNLEDAPKALMQWFRFGANHSERENPTQRASSNLLDALTNSKYTTVTWAASTLSVSYPDLWVERLLQCIATRNETHRATALLWSSLDGTFQQVSTWLTGFPGRIRFQNNLPHYDPLEHKYENWVSKTSQASSDSVVIIIDETASRSSFEEDRFQGLDRQCQTVFLTPDSAAFPTCVAGAESEADMFRADQLVLARVAPTQNEKTIAARNAMPAHYWLGELSR